MHELPFTLPCSNTTPMTLMHGHVNKWHDIKVRNKHKNPNLNMLKTKSI